MIPTLTVMRHSKAVYMMAKKKTVDNLDDPAEMYDILSKLNFTVLNCIVFYLDVLLYVGIITLP